MRFKTCNLDLRNSLKMIPTSQVDRTGSFNDSELTARVFRNQPTDRNTSNFQIPEHFEEVYFLPGFVIGQILNVRAFRRFFLVERDDHRSTRDVLIRTPSRTVPAHPAPVVLTSHDVGFAAVTEHLEGVSAPVLTCPWPSTSRRSRPAARGHLADRKRRDAPPSAAEGSARRPIPVLHARPRACRRMDREDVQRRALLERHRVAE